MAFLDESTSDVVKPNPAASSAHVGSVGNTFSTNKEFMKNAHLVMQMENGSLWNTVSPIVNKSTEADRTAAWAAYDNKCMSVYDDGQVTYGFGNSYQHKEIPVKVVEVKGKTWKTTSIFDYSKEYKNLPIITYSGEGTCRSQIWSPNAVVIPHTMPGASSVTNPLKVAYSLALFTYRDVFKYLRNHAMTLPEWSGVYDDTIMTIGELCALSDFGYNTGFYTVMMKQGSNDGSWIRAAVMEHQRAKVAHAKDPKGTSASVVAQKLQAVGATFLRYGGGKNPKGEKVRLPGLLKRRAAEFDMYSGKAIKLDRTDAEVNALADGLGVTAADLIVLSVDDTQRIEAANSVWSTVMGSENLPEDIMVAIQSGKSIDELMQLLQKYAADMKDKREEKAKKLAQNDNGEKVKTEKPQPISINNINMYPIADGRAMSGMNLHTTTKHGSAEENARNRKNLTQHIGAFKKYGQVNDKDLGQSKSTMFFLTRPEMCLYQNIADSKISNANFFEPSLQMRDPDLIDHLKIDRDLYIMLDRHIQPDFTDTNIAFIPAFTNQFRNATPPEVNFEFDKSASNIHGVGLSLPVYSSSDSADTTIPVTFNVDDDLSVMKYVDIIFKYAKSKKEGTTLPWKNVVKYNVIDFSMTLFMFTVGQDGVTLESWERSVGVIPANNPLSSIPKSSQAEKMESVNINFKTNTNLDSRKLSVIHHFNFLNRIGCTNLELDKAIGDIKNYDEAIDWYMTNYNLIETWVQDNMEYEDWYCERYQIFLDTDGVYYNYKIIGIPVWSRMQEILVKFTSDTRLKKLIKSDDSTPTYSLRFSKSAKYKKYGLDKSAYKDIPNYTNEETLSTTYNDMIKNIDTRTKINILNNMDYTDAKSFSDSIGLGHRTFAHSTHSVTIKDESGKTAVVNKNLWQESSSELKDVQYSQEWDNVLSPTSTLDKKYKGVTDFSTEDMKKTSYNKKVDIDSYNLFIAPKKSTETYFSNKDYFNEKTGLFIMKDAEEIYTKGIMSTDTINIGYTDNFAYTSEKDTKYPRLYAVEAKIRLIGSQDSNYTYASFIDNYIAYMNYQYFTKYGVDLTDNVSSLNPTTWKLDISHTSKLYDPDSRIGGSAPYIKDGTAYRKTVKIIKDSTKESDSGVIFVPYSDSEKYKSYMEGINTESNSIRGLGREVIETLDAVYYKENFSKLYEDMLLHLTISNPNTAKGILASGKRLPWDPYVNDVTGTNIDGVDRENVVYNIGTVRYTDLGMQTSRNLVKKNIMFGDNYMKQLEIVEKDKSDNASLNTDTHDKQKQLLSHFEEHKIPIFPDSSTTLRIGAWGFNVGAMADSLIDTAKASLANWAANNLSNIVTKKITELVVGKDNINKDKRNNEPYRMSAKDVNMLAKLKTYESLNINTKNGEYVSYDEYEEIDDINNKPLQSEEYKEQSQEQSIEFPKIEPIVVEEKYVPMQFTDMYKYKEDDGAPFNLNIDDKTLKAINSLLKEKNINDFDEEYNTLISKTEKSITQLESSVKYVDVVQMIKNNITTLNIPEIEPERFDIETDTDTDDIVYNETINTLHNLENMSIVRDNPIIDERRDIKYNDDRKDSYIAEYIEATSGEKLKFVRENPIQDEDFDIETNDDRKAKYSEVYTELTSFEKLKIVRENPIQDEDFDIETDHNDFKERFDTFLNRLYNFEKMTIVRNNPIPSENYSIERRNEDISLQEKAIAETRNTLSSELGANISKLNKTSETNMFIVHTKVSDMLVNNYVYDTYVDNKKVFDEAMAMYVTTTSGNISKISGSIADVSDIILAALE